LGGTDLGELHTESVPVLRRENHRENEQGDSKGETEEPQMREETW